MVALYIPLIVIGYFVNRCQNVLFPLSIISDQSAPCIDSIITWSGLFFVGLIYIRLKQVSDKGDSETDDLYGDY